MSNAGCQGRKTMLGPYRVQDLTNEKGLICGKTPSDPGADVFKAELCDSEACGEFGSVTSRAGWDDRC